MDFFDLILSKINNFLSEVGKIGLLFKDTILWIFRPPLGIKQTATQMEEVGIKSLPVVLITATFTGMVFAIQSYSGFRRFGAETLRVTEQIDALSTMASNPVKYLIVPRFTAALFMLPALTIIADVCGIFGGYVVSVNLLGSNPTIYLTSSFDILELGDITSGLIKSAFFGAIIAQIGCYYGFYAKGGAEGVGQATNRAVVISCMLILISNFFLAKILF